jgi:hypothetical protein
VLNEQPTAWDLGAVGIVAGLLLVSTDRRDSIDTQAVLSRLKRLLSHRGLPLSKSVQMLHLWQGEPRQNPRLPA